MIDIHNHLLQKLQEGPLTVEESVQTCEAPRPQGGASRARRGEPNASKGSLVHIIPLVGHLPAGSVSEIQ